jgi:hypothetical protein
VEVSATTADGQAGIVGDTLYADHATMTVHVRGAAGQVLAITRDGLPAGLVPITGDDETHTFSTDRVPTSGPLGTFWRVDTLDLQSLTTIGNPVFLRDPAARPAPAGPNTVAPADPTNTAGVTVQAVSTGRLPATGGRVPLGLGAALLLAAGLGRSALRRHRPADER